LAISEAAICEREKRIVLQSTKSQPAMKRSEDLVIRASPGFRRALPAAYKEQPLIWKAADAIFRNWRWTLALWALATIAVAGYALVAPREYESEMTFIVNNNRADSMSAPEGNASQPRPGDISDQQMSTEVQILSSRDLASKALRAAGFKGGTGIEQERALAKLQKNLQIAPVLKANMIRVRYAAQDPQQAVNVLEALAKAYPDQHVQLHGNPGQMGFFDEQSADAEKKLKDAGDKLLQLQRSSGVVSVADEKQMLLSRQIELQVTLHQAEAELRDTSKRIDSIKPRLDAMSRRISTQTRRLPNQYSVERMNTMLTELQNRRTELLSKYRAGERIVTQLDQQIADTKKALQSAEGSVATEEVSDVNPLRQGLETELERAEAAQAGLAGRIQSMRAQTGAYQGQLAKLETLAPVEQEYQREAKVAESNYLLYAKRREEARISQRMDEQKIANVVLAERPRIPILPKSRAGLLLVVYMLSLLIAALTGALVLRMKQTIETPWALEEISSVPVLGTVPVQSIALFSERLQRSI
jgi:uncharacterized protein involved in exopolysaccharide biosynthesis